MGRQGTVLGNGVLKGSPESRKRNVRIFAALLIVGVLAANVFAAAITFTGGSSLGVGTADIAACDDDGIAVKPVTSFDGSKFMVTALSLGDGEDIDEACGGLMVKGYILNSTSSSVGEIVSGTMDTAGVTFLLSTDVDASDVYSYVFEIAD